MIRRSDISPDNARVAVKRPDENSPPPYPKALTIVSTRTNTEKARIRLRLLHHAEKDLGKEKRKYIFHRITKHFRQRIAEFRFTDTMQIPLIQMLNLHLHYRKEA